MKNKSRGISLISLTLLLYIGMWVTSSCSKSKSKCRDNTKLGKVILVPLIGSNLNTGCENTRLCPTNRFIDDCMRDEFRNTASGMIFFPSEGFWSVDFTISAICDDGSEFEKTFKLPHSDVTVGLNNGTGLAYSVSGVPIDRNLTVAFTIREPCGRHTRVCSASQNDCTTFSYAASYMQFGEPFSSVSDNSRLNFVLNIQNPTAICSCTP